jgi:hypothetical protein
MDPDDDMVDEEITTAASTLAGLKLLNPDAVKREIADDPDAMSAYTDAVAAVGGESLGAARRRRRGGGPEPPGKKQKTSSGPSPASATSAAPPVAPSEPELPRKGRIASAVEAVSSAAPMARTVGAVVAVGTVLNRPTVYGNLARLAAEVIKTGTNTAITSTWGDWGTALLDIARSIGVVGELAAAQTAQGPVIPVSIATAIMAMRAQKAGISIGELVRRDAAAIQSSVSGAVTGQITAFRQAARSAPSEANIRTLKDIARQIKTDVEARAAETRAAEASRASAATASIRPAGDPIRVLADAPDAEVKAQREAISAALALASLSEEDVGGRRRRRRTKRKVPKRRRATRKLLTFVY